MHTLHLLALIEQISTAFATAWAFASEIISAAALLWLLNTLASLIRLTYESGLWVGHITKRYLIPLVLKAADKLSELNSHIDWQQVRDDLIHYLMIITAAVVAGLQVSWAWISTNIPAAYYWYEQRFIDVPQSAPVASVSTIKPLRDAKGRFISNKRTVRRHGRLVAA